MKTKRITLEILLLLIALVVFLSACHHSENSQSKNGAESDESANVPSTENTVSSAVTNDFSANKVFVGDIQNMILSLENDQDGYGELSNIEIVSSFVDENNHLYVVLSDHSVIDVGPVEDTKEKPTETKKQYTVDFYDYDGSLICSEKISEGEMAIAPNNPVYDGHNFIGWDKSISSINTDLEVVAQYEPIQSTPQIAVNNIVVLPGNKTAEVQVCVQNNPGILGLALQFDYDNRCLSLTKAVNGEALETLSFTKPGRFESPCRFTWDGIELSEEDINNGTILRLNFDIADNIDRGVYPVTLSCQEDDIIGRDLSPVHVELKSGNIIIIN